MTTERELAAAHRARLESDQAKLEADARALWASRVLDAWAANHSCDPFKTHPYQAGTEWHCVSAYECRRFKADSADAARLAAATALWPDLPEQVKRELGECP